MAFLPTALADQEAIAPEDKEAPASGSENVAFGKHLVELGLSTDSAEDSIEEIENSQFVTENVIEKTEILRDTNREEYADLFYGYLLNYAGGTPGEAKLLSTGNAMAGYQLEGLDNEIYQFLAEKIGDVAAGGTGETSFRIPVSALDLGGPWTAAELGIEAVQKNYGVTQEAIDALVDMLCFDSRGILDALLSDMPYELYWYDKTTGMSSGYRLGTSLIQQGGGEWKIGFSDSSELFFSFSVVEKYAAGEAEDGTYLQVDAAKISARKVDQAIREAQRIVTANEGKTNYEKLKAYKEAICFAVTYDDEAAHGYVPYGDPWQIISVFDNDASTNVVCEGYSKAFQYLCDLSEFRGDVQCYSVSGKEHMWNIVHMHDGKNYLVDVTNCDDGSVGAPDALFLAGVSSYSGADFAVRIPERQEGNLIFPADIIVYSYDEETKVLWDASGILNLSESSYVDNEAGAPPLQYTVSFTSGGGTGSMTAVDVKCGASCTLPENSFTAPAGKQFQAWSVDGKTYSPGAILTIIGDLTVTALWEDIPVLSGSCGKDLTWTLDSMGTLTISGTGEMRYSDYEYSDSKPGWYPYRDRVSSVEIEQGVSSIGRFAFFYCGNVKSVSLPEGIIFVDRSAFAGCTSLEKVSLPASLKILGWNGKQTETLYIRSNIHDSIVILDDAEDDSGASPAPVFSGSQADAKPAEPDDNSAFWGCTSLSEIDYAGTRRMWDMVEVTDATAEDLKDVLMRYRSPSFTVTYDYATNGGTSSTADRRVVKADENADLSQTAEKEGTEFLGWNTDPNAIRGLGNLIVVGDVTLYAIFLPYVVNGTIPGADISWTLDRGTGELAITGSSEIPRMIEYCPPPPVPGSWEYEGDDSSLPSFQRIPVPVWIGDADFLLSTLEEEDYILNPDGSRQFARDEGTSAPMGYLVYADWIKKATIGEGVTGLGFSTFEGCVGLTDVTIPVSVSVIRKYAFEGCDALSDIYYCGTEEQWKAVAIAASVQERLESVTIHYVPSTFTVTYDYAVNGGSSATASTKEVPINGYADLTPTAVKSGYVFTGWHTDPHMAYGLEELQITGDVTLYACFLPETTAELVTGRAAVHPGDTAEIQIALKNNPGIVSMLLNVSYDSSVMNLISVKDGGILGESMHNPDLSQNPFVLCWNNDTSADYTMDGVIVTLTFQIEKSAPEGLYPVSVTYDREQDSILNDKMEPVEFKVIQQGSLEVLAGNRIGDVNGDGKVTSLDRAYVARYLAKWTGYGADKLDLTAADVNQDGKVSSIDRMILARHLAKWEGYLELPYLP